MNEALNFMRDNTTGGLVVKAVQRKNGDIRYQMEAGHSYLLKDADIETLSRYNFKPRFRNKTPQNGHAARKPTP